MIKKNVQDALNNQIMEEFNSAYLYLAMAADFEEKKLKGFSTWMKAQAGEEMIHAMKLYNFVNDRDGKVELQGLDKPQATWKDPLEAFKSAYNHEQYITGCFNDLIKRAREEIDTATEIMLQWFVMEQVEEEAAAGEIVQKLEMMGGSKEGLYLLDQELGTRTLPSPGLAVAGGAEGE